MKKWVCKVCGYIYEGPEAPVECPVCHAKNAFEEVKGELKLAAEHKFGIYAETVKNNADTARKASETDLIHLRSVHDELERAAGSNDIDGFFEANQAFHQEVQHIADNRWLTQAITDLRKVIKLSRHHSLFSDGRLKQSLAEHRAILDALAHRDVARSEQLMREHISSGRQALAKVAARRDSAA